MAAASHVIDVQRHPQGPRVFILGRRIHEYMLGVAILIVLLAGRLSGHVHTSIVPLVVASVGVWLIAKDWRDIFPATRDTASWQLGIHRRAAPLRRASHAKVVPPLAAVLAIAVAAVNMVSAATADIPSRVRLLVRVEPISALPAFHALALPAAAALALVALSLGRRQRRALHIALALLVCLGTADLLKGLDVEEATLSFGLAGLLWLCRAAFYVESEPLRLRGLLRQAPAIVMGVAAVTALAVWAAVPEGTPGPAMVREAATLLTVGNGKIPLRDEFGWLPLGLGLVGVGLLLGAASLLFRPRRIPREAVGGQAYAAAHGLVREHGRDTLAFFKLRRDAQLFFGADRTAFLAYRVSNRVLVISGDPIGPAEALPELLRDVCRLAERSGLKVGAIGVGAEHLPLYVSAGLNSIYLGDEAIVDTRAFSLEGRSIRKVRQLVTRLEKAGFTTTVHEVGELDAATASELEEASRRWRGDSAERGFSMAMDSFLGETQAETVVVVARDAGGRLRGFLHFVPTFGRSAMSLSLMRRDHETPNGLTEFLVVRSIEQLRDRGIEELSLNFAAFARLLASPSGLGEHLLARLIRLGNPFFQIESLYRFNAKFRPRWEPRYVLFETAISLPRTGLALMHAEGLLPSFVRSPFKAIGRHRQPPAALA
ncbi:MAG: phosphatidylglycerol lysyltransferase domain-containing protein [Thermoleophilia bacterium]|nr:phosphatidylglycerol lysyltransferase domain-containing protein [Thermoleophilia bacterium]